jgi:4-methyl-5(b-hydroxyethyl)-thiazole monophosphate biosynthesis
MKTGIILAPGFEEGEALTIADILRRAQIQCDLIGLDQTVTGGHEIEVQSDVLLNNIDENEYDMLILPGGYGGVEAMKQSTKLKELLISMNKQNKYIAAMCAAPSVLDCFGLLKGRKFTAYRGYEEKIKDGTFLQDKVVVDDNLITSRGPATAYAFAYKLVDVLGQDSLAVKKRMVYFNAFDVKEDE